MPWFPLNNAANLSISNEEKELHICSWGKGEEKMSWDASQHSAMPIIVTQQMLVKE